MTPSKTMIWGIDPGNEVCGVSQLLDGRIGFCFNEPSGSVYRKIVSLSDGQPFHVVIEDVYPYSMRLTPEIIATCKVIGELSYRFSTCKLAKSVNLEPRNSVKKWIFDTVPDVVLPRIEKNNVRTLFFPELRRKWRHSTFVKWLKDCGA